MKHPFRAALAWCRRFQQRRRARRYALRVGRAELRRLRGLRIARWQHWGSQ